MKTKPAIQCLILILLVQFNPVHWALMRSLEVEQTHCSNKSWGIYGLIIVAALLFFALMCCTLYRVDMKKYFQKRKPNAVYEDMSYSSRRNTLIRANAYVTDN